MGFKVYKQFIGVGDNDPAWAERKVWVLKLKPTDTIVDHVDEAKALKAAKLLANDKDNDKGKGKNTGNGREFLIISDEDKHNPKKIKESTKIKKDDKDISSK